MPRCKEDDNILLEDEAKEKPVTVIHQIIVISALKSLLPWENAPANLIPQKRGGHYKYHTKFVCN
jgi:hypothetical protein